MLADFEETIEETTDDFIVETTDEDQSDYRVQDQDDQPQERAAHRAVPRPTRKRRKGKGRTGVDRRRVTARRLPVPADDPDETPNVAAASEPDEIELWTRKKVLAFFGNIHVSTLYRGIASERYPPPMNTSDNVVRWIGSECRAALVRMRDERGKTVKPKRGRPRKQIIP